MRSRVLSGMRPTGAMHLGHYHGALKNWVRLQHEHECFFFVADWHALTTHYEERDVMERYVYEMVVDWIAAGLDPGSCTIFIQSRLPEHAELFTLLAMGTPLGWLERVPTYKDQIDKLKDRDLATYGFLGYPLLQAADILIYKATYVPVGEDQSSHVELTREVARRFNNLYGRSRDFDAASPPRWPSCPRTTRATSRSSARPSARPASPRRWPRARACCARQRRR
jgi:tryptophanyl-tRNA synthetase